MKIDLMSNGKDLHFQASESVQAAESDCVEEDRRKYFASENIEAKSMVQQKQATRVDFTKTQTSSSSKKRAYCLYFLNARFFFPVVLLSTAITCATNTNTNTNTNSLLFRYDTKHF